MVLNSRICAPPLRQGFSLLYPWDSRPETHQPYLAVPRNRNQKRGGTGQRKRLKLLGNENFGLAPAGRPSWACSWLASSPLAQGNPEKVDEGQQLGAKERVGLGGGGGQDGLGLACRLVKVAVSRVGGWDG